LYILCTYWNKYNERPSARHLNQTRRPTFDVSLLIIIIIIIIICFASTYKYYYYYYYYTTYRKVCLRRVAAAAGVRSVEYRQRIATNATLNNSNIDEIIITITDIVRTGDWLRRYIYISKVPGQSGLFKICGVRKCYRFARKTLSRYNYITPLFYFLFISICTSTVWPQTLTRGD